jgi:carbonic anhydrase
MLSSLPHLHGLGINGSMLSSLPHLHGLAVDDKPRRTASTPADVLAALKAGNVRYWTGKPKTHHHANHHHHHHSRQQGELPHAMVIGCADSRAPVELLFDQHVGASLHPPALPSAAFAARAPSRAGPGAQLTARKPPSHPIRAHSTGDLFVARNAGNLWGHSVAASIDYAVFELGVKVVVFLGHEGCGAVKAARLPPAEILHQPKELREMLLLMKASLEYCHETLDHIQDATARDREQVTCNAQAQVRRVLGEKHLRALVESGELVVIGAFYAISSGIVDFIEADRWAWSDDRRAGAGASAANSAGHSCRRTMP